MMAQGLMDGATAQSPSNSSSRRVSSSKKSGLKSKSRDIGEDSKDAINESTKIPGSSKKVHKESPNSSADQPPTKKRRVLAEIDSTGSPAAAIAFSSPSALKRQPSTKKKSVSFSVETKEDDGDTAISIIPSELNTSDEVSEAAFEDATPLKKKKAKKQKTTKSEATPEQKTHPALQYLTEFTDARDSWKFNKNKETWLLKHLFSIDNIPTSYDKSLGAYLSGLKGEAAKQRIIKQAKEELTHVGGELKELNTNEDSNGEKRQSMDNPEARELYRADAARRYKRNYDAYLEALEKDEYKLGPECNRAFAKRKRAEIVLWAIDAEIETSSTTNKPGSTANGVKSEEKPAENLKRKRKNRTVVVDFSDSSDSDSSSDESDKPTSSTKSKSTSSKSTTTNSKSDSESDSDSTSDSETSSSGSESDSGSDSSSDSETDSDSDSSSDGGVSTRKVTKSKSTTSSSSSSSGPKLASTDSTSSEGESDTSSDDTSSDDSD